AAVSRTLSGGAAAPVVRAYAYRSRSGGRTRGPVSRSEPLRAEVLPATRAIVARRRRPLGARSGGGAAQVLSPDECAQGGAHRAGVLRSAPFQSSVSSPSLRFFSSIARTSLIHSDSLRRSVRVVLPVLCSPAATRWYGSWGPLGWPGCASGGRSSMISRTGRL